MEVNFFGTMALCGAVAGVLRRQGWGSIVNVSSSLGAAALPLYGGYCASKAALEAATEALHLELVPLGVSVRILRPGLVATAFGGKRAAQAPAVGSPYARPARQSGTGRSVDHLQAGDRGGSDRRHGENLEQPEGTFRVTVGEDAVRWVGNRRRLDDESFLRGAAEGGYPFR